MREIVQVYFTQELLPGLPVLDLKRDYPLTFVAGANSGVYALGINGRSNLSDLRLFHRGNIKLELFFCFLIPRNLS